MHQDGMNKMNINNMQYLFTYFTPVLDLVMMAPIQLQCIFSYANLANPEVEPHAPNTYQSKLIPSGSIISNKSEGST